MLMRNGSFERSGRMPEANDLLWEDALRNAIREFVTHYHLERNHQGLDNRLIVPMKTIPTNGTIRKHQRLGGMLDYYYREPPDFSFWSIRRPPASGARPFRRVACPLSTNLLTADSKWPSYPSLLDRSRRQKASGTNPLASSETVLSGLV